MSRAPKTRRCVHPDGRPARCKPGETVVRCVRAGKFTKCAPGLERVRVALPPAKQRSSGAPDERLIQRVRQMQGFGLDRAQVAEALGREYTRDTVYLAWHAAKMLG